MEEIEVNQEQTNKTFPNKEVKYQQIVEEIKLLIPFLTEEMKSCPNSDIIFNLFETVDFYSLKRHFNIKSTTQKKNPEDELLNQFLENFYSTLSNFDSFLNLPPKKSIFELNSNNKGLEFKFPKIFDINGDEAIIQRGEDEIFVFLYDNFSELESFIKFNSNFDVETYCIGMNLNFFEVKTWIKNNNLLEKKNLFFYFTDISSLKIINLDFDNIPRIMSIGKDNIITKDKYVKYEKYYNILNVSINPNIINENINSDEVKFAYLDNEDKKKIIKTINLYLRKCGLKDVHFYVRTKISLDKNGLRRIKCQPIFYGEADEKGKNLVDNLIKILNVQDVFKDAIQNKVISKI